MSSALSFRSPLRRGAVLLAILGALAACGDDDDADPLDSGVPEADSAVPPDARPDVRDTGLPPGQCRTARDCPDQGYCSGDPTCEPISAGATIGYCSYPGRCFTGGDGRCAFVTCNEAERRCDTVPYDGDGDGHYPVGCPTAPADDCAEWDSTRFPGNPEVCDPGGHDEDCDPDTVGPDVDGDGASPTRCCDAERGACGTDCDDLDPARGPGATESGANACDGIDNDCNGAIDDACACEPGMGDCDAMPGCEVDLRTDLTSCGRCGNRCAPGERCIDGTCNPTVGIAVGSQASCALRFDATVWCWGGNRRGQLGDGSYTDRAAPVPVQGLADVAQIVAAGEHVCARLSDGSARCWGYGGHGQLGDGEVRTSATPVTVAGLAGVADLALGRFHSCALHTDGTVSCWGYNALGQLGDGTMSRRPTPTRVSDLSGVRDLAAGGYMSCALHDGGISCWGDHTGTGIVVARPELLLDSEGTRWSAIAAGANHVCAIDPGSSAEGDEGFVCWGRNDAGEVGEWTGLVPARNPLSGTDAIVAGGDLTCVIQDVAEREDGSLYCWGNAIPLGAGMFGSSAFASTPAGLSFVSSFAVSEDHACAIVDGRVRCAGNNAFGQTGDGTTTYRTDFDSEVPGLR